jgi:hypothetical protein
MKKFVIGFVCGATIAASTAAVASDSIQAYLFPSQVTIRSGETIQEIDETGENAVINVNGKSYIPLRTFAEAMGAKVHYEESLSSDGTDRHIGIQIGEVPDSNQLTLSDPDNYVNMGQIHMVQPPNGHTLTHAFTPYVLTSGTIRINKELKNKEIELTVLDTTGNLLGRSNFVYVDNSDVAPPAPGETRSFSTFVSLRSREIGSYRIAVRDVMTAQKREQIDIFLNNGIVAAIYPPNGFNQTLPAAEIAPFRVSFQNNYKHDIVLEPYDMTLYVHRIDENNNPVALITEKKLPTIAGPLGGWSSYTIPVLWNPANSEGLPLSPGRYKISLDRPKSVSYSRDGRNPTTENLLRNTRTPDGFIFELK